MPKKSTNKKPATSMADKLKLPATIRDFKYESWDIPPGDLLKDDSYQRTYIDENRALKIAENYDPDAFGAIIVGRRKDKKCYVVDGWHRKIVAELLGRETVPCLVFNSTGAPHEAMVFKMLNKDRRNVTPIDVFLAELTAGDPVVTEMAGVIHHAGFKVTHVPGNNNLRAVAALRSVHKQGRLAEVLDMLHWFDNADSDMLTISRKGIFVSFLAALRTPELWEGNIKEARLKKLIKNMTVQRWHSVCDAVYRTGGGGNRGKLIAESWVVRVYNTRLAQENKVWPVSR